MTYISRLEENKRLSKRNDSTVEKRDKYKGYEYLVVLTNYGHRCGYVAIPEGHPLHACEGYDDERISELDMHGGCTFYQKQMTDEVCSDKWIGFDCAHFQDKPDLPALKKHYLKQYQSEMLTRIENKIAKIVGSEEFRTVKDLDFAVGECKNIIDQITIKYSN